MTPTGSKLRPPTTPEINLWKYAQALPGHGFSDEHVRFLAESLPAIVWTAEPDGRHDYMNKRWFLYTGLTEEETYGELKSAVHPDDFPRYKRMWEESVRTGAPYEMEYRFRSAADGVYRWHIGRALPVRNQHGMIVKWLGTAVDIHAQKEAEERLQQMNEQLELIVQDRVNELKKENRQRRRAEEKYKEHADMLQRTLEMFPKAVAASDARGRILYANEKFYTLFDVTTVSPNLRQGFEIFGLLRRRFPTPECDAAVRTMLVSNTPTKSEVVDGEVTYSIEYIPVKQGENDANTLIMVKDVSQEKRVDAAKSEFMSLASHQLRTPLTAVRWALSRLGRMVQGRLKPEEEHLLKRAHHSAATMAETISTMLSISRVEAGLHPINKENISLYAFLRTLEGEHREDLAERKLSLLIECPHSLSVRTDPHMLKEMIENLLSNAIKYTPAEGSITVGAEQKENAVVIRVRDTGYGIPLHEQKRVFSKFFRGENIVKTDTQGTGLGLYLVSLLAHAVGATVTFASDEGKGTEFVLTVQQEVE